MTISQKGILILLIIGLVGSLLVITANERLVDDQRQQIEELSLERNQIFQDYLYLRERYYDETGRWFRLPSLDSEPIPGPGPIPAPEPIPSNSAPI
ncbi:hypothetical protein C4544_01580 [candidate division WS5 bacterium]|uniref:Uncharacterized protein n=1 Tax=candidate division WS5 bacterium TaxID=2093353 RepID=A0A419DFF6_9BACT|nr:MAG: hypothetical protein C4544_01580 [candidate division WS5 bacterium]